MKCIFSHILFRLLVLILLTNCSNQEDNNFDPNDWDLDGVSNEKEYFDNTDPNDPCSLHTSSQYPPNVPESWKNLDCDGDGVTNGQEILDRTYLFDPCDFNIDKQNIDIISSEWKNLDCDGDGVTNFNESQDNTNQKDNCDFVLSSMTLSPDENWLKLDCDNDGRTNEDEINDNTDPIDGNDFLGKGSKLDYIRTEDGYLYTFNNKGRLLKRIEHSTDGLLTDFIFDNQNKLIEVVHANEGVKIDFSYTNNILSEIRRHENNQTLIYEISFDSSSNTYSKKLKNSTSDITYYTFNSINRIKQIKSDTYEERFEYDNNGDILSSSFTTSTFYSGHYTYYSKENVKNPLKLAYDTIYLQYVLMEQILKKSFYIKFGAFNSKYLLQMSRFSSPTSHTYSYGLKSIQENGLPSLGYRSDFSFNYDIYYYYKE